MTEVPFNAADSFKTPAQQLYEMRDAQNVPAMVEETVYNVEETNCTVEEIICPVEETVCTAEETVYAVEETVCNAEGTICPVENAVCTVKETVYLAEGTICPNEETVCTSTVEESANAAEETVRPTKEMDCQVEEIVYPVEETVYSVEETVSTLDEMVCSVEQIVCTRDNTISKEFDPAISAQIISQEVLMDEIHSNVKPVHQEDTNITIERTSASISQTNFINSNHCVSSCSSGEMVTEQRISAGTTVAMGIKQKAVLRDSRTGAGSKSGNKGRFSVPKSTTETPVPRIQIGYVSRSS
jgi:hypothetical protein